jgi:hypothetical protein
MGVSVVCIFESRNFASFLLPSPVEHTIHRAQRQAILLSLPGVGVYVYVRDRPQIISILAAAAAAARDCKSITRQVVELQLYSDSESDASSRTFSYS